MTSIVLITGANRGIGSCILERLLSAFPGNRYILGCRDMHKGHELIKDFQSRFKITSDHHLDVLELDVASPESIGTAVKEIATKYGRIDVLINNAGVAHDHSTVEDDLNALEQVWQKTFAVNVFGPHLLFQALMPLLTKANAPRVINLSSGRASLSRSAGGDLPPTAVLSYSVSKVALNGLGVEMDKILSSKTDARGRIWNINPGHCKTAFNGYKGKRDPLDGARVVEVLLERDCNGDTVDSGFWEEEGGQLQRVPW